MPLILIFGDVEMLAKILKILFFLFAGIIIFNKITPIIFGESIIVSILAFLFGYFWMGYLIRYYFPRVKVEKRREDEM